MQKIFIITSDYNINETTPGLPGSTKPVNDFLGDTGFIVSVTPQDVHISTSGTGSNFSKEIRGRWLVVADNGKGIQL